jgi:nucleotide-binding universal stress UspA family protein
MYKKILVAIDGSATSLRGLNEAIRLARATGGRLMLVHVVQELVIASEDPTGATYTRVIDSLRSVGASVLAQATSTVQQADVPCEEKLVQTIGGSVADEIVKQAKLWSADLIVLGTHGRRGLKRLAMGSDAELVVRLASVPVLLVREPHEAS